MSRRGIWIAAGAALLAGGVVLTRWPPINDVTTGRTPQYPDLQPREYRSPPSHLFAAVGRTARMMTGWRVTAEDTEARVLHAVAWVPLTPFHDDVTVSVEPVPGGGRVIVRSRSRIGRGDLGVNARRIRAFLRALDRELSPRSR